MSFSTLVAPVSGPLAPALSTPSPTPPDTRPIMPLAPEAPANFVSGGAEPGVIVESQAASRAATIDFVADSPAAFGIARDVPPPLADADRTPLTATQHEANAIYGLVASFTG